MVTVKLNTIDINSYYNNIDYWLRHHITSAAIFASAEEWEIVHSQKYYTMVNHEIKFHFDYDFKLNKW